MKPPRAAELILLAFAGDSEGEFVAGDLAEDFGYLLAQKGRRVARRWYAWQVVRSVPALLAPRMRSGELTGVVLRAVLGVLLPLVALDRLWSFVYSQIPLKDGLDRAPAMLAANVMLLTLCSWMVGGISLADRRHDRRRAGPDVVAALAAAVLAVRAALGATPAPYIVGLLLAAPASSLWAFWRGKLR